MINFQSGAQFDVRPSAAKLKDYKFAELVAAADPVQWVEKPQDQWRKFPIFNQGNSGSCVMQTECKEMGIMRQLADGIYVHFSVADGYQRRNPKLPGMGAINARKIASEGITLEVLTPSQNMSDIQLDATIVEPYKREIGKIFSVPNYIELPSKNIDTIASVIQRTKKGVMLWFYFEYAEWDTQPHVINTALDLYAIPTLRHSVTAVDFTLLPNGKKALIIEDSWGPGTGIGGQRIIDEDFFNARNWYAGYLVNFRFNDKIEPNQIPPKHTFTKTLQFSPIFIVDNDVKELQNILKYEGLFPVNSQSTGYYGSITSKAVLNFQKKYNIASDDELNQLQGRIVGPKTKEILNQIYSK